MNLIHEANFGPIEASIGVSLHELVEPIPRLVSRVDGVLKVIGKKASVAANGPQPKHCLGVTA